ncbi:MAG: tRNA (adenosine(37)-N6)-threonylcarbamoyltransferase complex dimerization subunit type 1 TsaB [Candidatus Eremiobacteraeota bacterium]|nr:tRNA (adenosine(37)-N6)-threonylcarbamoyltransferase complex dimerization subunit type 1 TsaB [Candidatus Eremiobacteraeota bacterium]
MSAGAVRPERGVLLALDAAPGVGSVALVRTGEIVIARAVAMRSSVSPADRVAGVHDDDPLMRAVAETLTEGGLAPRDLGGVACGAGPGGFTSLRIAAAIAKGLAHAAGCPLLAGPSLAWAAAMRAPAPGVWLVTLDALRGESYVARVELGPRSRGLLGEGWPVVAYTDLGVQPSDSVPTLAGAVAAIDVLAIDADAMNAPIAAGAVAWPLAEVDLARWEPRYGRQAEAQVRWEAAHGPLPAPNSAPTT